MFVLVLVMVLVMVFVLVLVVVVKVLVSVCGLLHSSQSYGINEILNSKKIWNIIFQKKKRTRKIPK